MIPISERRYRDSSVEDLRQALLMIEESARAYLQTLHGITSDNESHAFIRMQGIQHASEAVLFDGRQDWMDAMEHALAAASQPATDV